MRTSEIEKVVRQCSEYFGVPVEAIMGRSRHAEVVAPRHSAYAILRYRGAGAKELSRYFKVDHTSILHGASKGFEYPLNQIVEVVV